MNIKKKLLVSLGTIASISLVSPAISSCSKRIAVEGVKFDQEYSWVQLGSTRDFSQEVKITPENATNKKLKWTISEESSNGNVADVDADTGVVTGKARGYAKLTCVSTDDATKASEQWIVVGQYKELTDFDLSETEKTIYLGETGQITTLFTPVDASIQYVKWESSNTDIAEVDENGNVTVKDTVGTATITATPYDYDVYSRTLVPVTSLTKTCDIIADYAPAENVFVLPESIDIETGDTFNVYPCILPLNAKQDLNVQIYPEDFLTYDLDTCEGKAGDTEGTGYIIFSSVDYPLVTNVCTVRITQKIIPVESIEFAEGSTKEMVVNDKWTPTITIEPETASSKEYYFISSDPEIAYIDPANTKQIIAKKPGTVGLTVKCADGSKSDTCSLTVKAKKVTSVELPATSVVEFEQTLKLNPTILPTDATDKSLTWSSENENIAKVANGIVYGVSEGKTNISATTNDGSQITATCEVTVTKNFVKIETITIDSEKTINISSQDQTITPTITPSDASNKDVYWEVDDSSILTLIQPNEGEKSAKLIPVKGGTTKIRAYSSDGSVRSNDCSVTVKYDDIQSIEMPASFWQRARTTAYLQYKVVPATACPDVGFSSSEPTIVSVDDAGFMRLIKEGQATITCTSVDNPSVTATCNVLVGPGEPIHVDSITFLHQSDKRIHVRMGEIVPLPEIVYSPWDATNKEVKWTVDVEGYIDVNPIAKTIIPRKPTTGSPAAVRLTATSLDNPNAKETAFVYVDPVKAEHIDVTSAPTSLERQETQLITTRVLPAEAVQDVTFESSNENILKIENPTFTSCTVRGINAGDATIKIKSVSDPECETEVNVKVINYISFVNDSWASLCNHISIGGLGRLRNVYKADWERNKEFPNSLTGYKRKIVLNDNLEYEVRVIGENHDLIAGESNRATLTFELANVISKNTKDAFKGPWGGEKEGVFTNSTIYSNLNGGSKQTFSKPMVDWVRANPGIGNSIKKVHKEIYAFTKDEGKTKRNVDCFLFPLSLTEMNFSADNDEGNVYHYYAYAKGKNAKKIKTDLNGKIQYYWLVSQSLPDLYSAVHKAHFVYDSGDSSHGSPDRDFAISFAFCI